MAWHFTTRETISAIKYEPYCNSALPRTLREAAEGAELLEFPGC